MPMYTYRCPQCQATFDRRNVKVDARDSQKGCPYCEQEDVSLHREEVAETQGRLSWQWGRWQDK